MGWNYTGGGPELGGTVRWGVTNNLTLNGTANPDFSQIESDAQQFVFDPRNELFFQEKRPFFLEAIEQFTTPSNSDLHPADRAARRGRQAHRKSVRDRPGPAFCAVDDPAVSASG